MTLSRTLTCRFYGALNRFLPHDRHYRAFSCTVKGIPAIKDTVEALGVPHTEIDCIVVNGESVGFSCQIRGGERVLVYPDAGAVKLKKIIRLKPAPPVHPKFTADVHLGKLARHLRLLGFDVLYRKDMTDGEIIACSCPVRRIVLTRDIGLLKHRRLRFGYFVRAIDPLRQIREIVRHFDLAGKIRPFRLCLECNGVIRRIAKSKIESRLPPLTKEHYARFYHCPRCDKIYWQGAHYKQLLRIIKVARK